MTSLLALSLILLSDISLRIAPERALPITYPDEPTILQISDHPAGIYRVSGSISGPDGNEFSIEIPRLTFTSSPYYLTLPNVPDTFGPLTVTLDLNNSDSQQSATTTFYRNHRPDHKAPGPLCMTFPEWNADSHTVALEVPLKEARVFLDSPDVDQAISSLSDLNTSIRAVIGQPQAPATEANMESWVSAYGDQIQTWEFNLGDDSQHTLNLIQLLRQLKPDAQVALRTQSTEAFQQFLPLGNTLDIHDFVLTEANPDLHHYRSIAQQAGIEHTNFSREITQANLSTTYSQLTTPTATFAPLTISIPPIDTTTSQGLDSLSLFNHWGNVLPNYEALGPYYIHQSLTAQVYRSRIPGKPSLFAITADSPQTITLPESLQSYTPLSHRFTPLKNSSVQTINFTDTPIFLQGDDSAPLAQAICNSLIQETQSLLAIEAYLEILPETSHEVLNNFIHATPETSFRTPFLTLIRQFPEIEEKFSTGEVPQHIAIPLMARLTHLTRLIAALEQLSGTPFLESPNTTLAQCNDFLNQYHSRGIQHAPHSREARLLSEINRLMNEARSLDTRGLTIEATAVATIAEWRVRALLKRNE